MTFTVYTFSLLPNQDLDDDQEKVILSENPEARTKFLQPEINNLIGKENDNSHSDFRKGAISTQKATIEQF